MKLGDAGALEPGFYWMAKLDRPLAIAQVYVDNEGLSGPEEEEWNELLFIELGTDSVLTVKSAESYVFERIKEPKQLLDIIAGKQPEVTIQIAEYDLNGDRIRVHSDGTWGKATTAVDVPVRRHFAS